MTSNSDRSNSKRINNLKRRLGLFRSESFPHAILIVINWFLVKIKSTLYSIIFNANGITIGPRSIIRGSSSITFGDDISVNGDLWLEAVHIYRSQLFKPSVTLGDRLSLSKNVHITCIDDISIGANVLIGSNVYISDHNHGSYTGPGQSNPSDPPADRILVSGGPVKIGSNVWIGNNVVIMGPALIGEGTIIAANSFVKGNIPPKVIIAGSPAKIIKRFDDQLGAWIKI